jgi:hypothetical protein
LDRQIRSQISRNRAFADPAFLIGDEYLNRVHVYQSSFNA